MATNFLLSHWGSVRIAHRDDMQLKLDSLEVKALCGGLKINQRKTKAIEIGRGNHGVAAIFTVNNAPIGNVDTFTYLGSEISPNGGAEADITCRIRKAQGAYAQLKNIWHSNRLTLKTKIRIFNSNVKAVLLYGCETWLVTVTLTKKLQTFVNRCLRRILRIWWPNTISNVNLLRKCRQRNIELEVRERKWRWIGHALRRDGEICKEVLEWNPQGSRRQGRPANTWRRSLLSEIKLFDSSATWTTIKPLARDRRRWKEFIMALCY